MTRGQRKAISDLLPVFGIPVPAGEDDKVDMSRVFERSAPLVLEIGFGDGEALVEMSRSRASENFIGIDVHEPGIGHLILRLREEGLGNVRVMKGDAVELLARAFSDRQFDRICLFFPDPWPKKRHHKRRILQPAFVSLVAARLKPGGLFHFATDWQDYAEQALDMLQREPALENAAESGYCTDTGLRPATKFERRGRRLGHGVWDILMRRR